MLDPETKKCQEALARRVVTIQPPQPQGAVPASSDLSFAWRLAVYHESFLGRTISALVDAVLAPAVSAFGGDCVKEVTARFFAKNPPSAGNLEKALVGLPEFIMQNAAGILAQALASVVQASLVWWDLLVGVDDLGQTQPNSLGGPAALIEAAGPFDLWRVFVAAEAASATPGGRSGAGPIVDEEEAADLLLVKTGVDTIVALPSPRCLRALSLALVRGHDVAGAIAALSVDEVETLSLSQLRDCLANLKARGVLA